ncbi:hypothetical protein [Streptomyces echinatus]|uniref:Transcriptional regulator GlxA family with amidase domain n=1 Tax=Streptomyces echinatus TaxID=67293 RepID=A0A7W9UP03_9ACTN|nr:hypothetical protein [Streptomyces echinatus]MBB5925848.1 transcriptional regulator GlxA family with amidase domain [Streptomyces echinatus]
MAQTKFDKQFIRALRAERADHLRSTTTMPTAAIAQQVGYQDPATVRQLRASRRPIRE